jgi:hypothetical protein
MSSRREEGGGTWSTPGLRLLCTWGQVPILWACLQECPCPAKGRCYEERVREKFLW